MALLLWMYYGFVWLCAAKFIQKDTVGDDSKSFAKKTLQKLASPSQLASLSQLDLAIKVN